MNEKHVHLNEEQFNLLVDAQATGAESFPASTAMADARTHLDICEDCRRLFGRYADITKQLEALKHKSGVQAKDNCPDEADLRRLVTEDITNDQAEQLLRHLMNCDDCNTKLRANVEDLVSEPSTPGRLTLDHLRSSDPQWQAQLAHRLARRQILAATADRERIRPFPKRGPLRWLLAVAAVLLVAFSGTSLYLLSKRPSVGQLLTAAYSEKRTLDLRIPGASYVPFVPLPLQRGSGEPTWQRPPSLLEAEARIVRDDRRHRDDADWLAARGQAALLNHEFDAAILDLKTSLAIAPRSPSARIDLASAYSEHARKSDQPWENAEAVEILTNLLRQQPQNKVAIFNLALILERQSLFHQAAEQWRNYLRIDPAGGWADEARTHLEKDENGISKMNRQLPLLDVLQIAAATPGNSAVIADALDERAEEYLHEATIHWLPSAFPLDGTSQPSTQYRSALRALGAVLQKRHHDTWMVDLVKHANSSAFSSGISLLRTAIVANDAGDYDGATLAAHLAAGEFLSAKSRAGNLRSRLEEVYSFRLSQNAARCGPMSASLAHDAGRASYAWVVVQTTLEQQECLNMLGEFGQALSLSTANLARAQAARYSQLYLRAVLFAADTEASLGDTKNAWRRTRDGLATSWDTATSSMRTYSLDTELDFLADHTGKTRFDEIVLSEALATLGEDRDVLLRAMANHRLAQAALAADDPGIAEEHFQAAVKLFSFAPATSVTAERRMEAEIGLARAELQRRDSLSAIRRLSQMQNAMRQTSSRYLQIDFFQTLGEANLRAKRPQEADIAFCSALKLTESALDKLHSDSDRLEWDHEAGRTYRMLVESKLEQNDVSSALEVWEWYRAAAIRRMGRGGAQPVVAKTDEGGQFVDSCPMFKIRAVHSQLSSLSEAIVITYAVLPQGIAGWAYDNRGVRFHWISTDEVQTSQLLGRFATLCAEPGSDPAALRELGRKLYDQLLAPFSDRLTPNRRIIFEPDGILWSTPFSALLRPDGSYLSDFSSLSEFPGIYYRSLLQPIRAFQLSDPALFVLEDSAVRYRENDLPALPSAAGEIKAVARQFPNTTLLRNQQASLAIISRYLHQAVIFHFAGHAIQTVTGTSLVLRPTGRQSDSQSTLGADGLASMQFPNLRLAVLSACTTDGGTEGNGLLDAGSLARVFLYRGVRQVIASRWAVDSAATEELMTSFYTSLLEGTPAPQALRLAMHHVRDRSSTSHPYYWAAFASLGWS